MNHTQCRRAAILFFLLVLAGCTRDGGGARLSPVKGRVIFKNTGLTAATIYFLPDAEKGNRGAMASAVLEEDGSFTMSTYQNAMREGVVPGSYKVTIDVGRRNEPELQKYRQVKTSPLTIDVPEEGLEEHVFELK
jgi:hypothetical protein